MSLTPMFSGEMMLLKASWSSGTGSVVAFALADDDDLAKFKDMTTKKGNRAGQRLAVVMVEIGDDERPVQPAAESAEKPLSVQAAMLCKALGFWRYCEHMQGYAYADPIDREQQATHYLRAECQVASRSELDTNGAAAARFILLRNGARNYALEHRQP